MRIIIELDSTSSQPEIKKVGGSDADHPGTGVSSFASAAVDAGYAPIQESIAPDNVFSAPSSQVEPNMAVSASQAIDAGPAKAPGSEVADSTSLPQEMDSPDKANAISAGEFTGQQE